MGKTRPSPKTKEEKVFKSKKPIQKKVSASFVAPVGRMTRQRSNEGSEDAGVAMKQVVKTQDKQKTIQQMMSDTKSGIPAKTLIQKHKTGSSSNIVVSSEMRSQVEEQVKVTSKLVMVNGEHVFQNIATQLDANQKMEKAQREHDVVQVASQRIITSHTYLLNRQQTLPWSPYEKKKFEWGLRLFGTDFAMIETLFESTRNRKQIKSHFIKIQKENIQRVNELIESNIGLAEFEHEFGKLEGQQAASEESSSDEDVLEEHRKITDADRKKIIIEAFRDKLRVDRIEDFKPKMSYAKIGKKFSIWSSIVQQVCECFIEADCEHQTDKQYERSIANKRQANQVVAIQDRESEGEEEEQEFDLPPSDSDSNYNDGGGFNIFKRHQVTPQKNKPKPTQPKPIAPKQEESWFDSFN